jgi:RHS repeat-associated protein
VLLQDDSESLAGTTPEQLSRLLYAGEYFDANAQMYYNRARWYNPYNGRFNRMDPFAGSPQDPQSLHKYAYAHANPINAIDPSGSFSILGTGTRALIGIGLLAAVIVAGVGSLWFRSRNLKPATNSYQNNILNVRVNPVILKSGYPGLDTLERIENQKGHLEEALSSASEFWQANAGIKFSWDEIQVVDMPSYLHIESTSMLDNAISEFYNGSPVVLVVDNLDNPESSGWTSHNRNGCALIRNIFSSGTLAHEIGHMLIPRKFTFSLWSVHIEGNPSNLMSSGAGRLDRDYPFGLNDLFLSQQQVNVARNTVVERDWN